MTWNRGHSLIRSKEIASAVQTDEESIKIDGEYEVWRQLIANLLEFLEEVQHEQQRSIGQPISIALTLYKVVVLHT